ncbi:hypothetical protein L1987_58257 [Smallanthus sonchifolius]|uniref:Uncharacterized protein n=1 Tax=Smallanthus sonchifolius TaxID=185202 RepID=A0ACB9DFT9_9ASTR|nr:hypothetical protein L1987_58257 [Smallanthus sonchifolius]
MLLNSRVYQSVHEASSSHEIRVESHRHRYIHNNYIYFLNTHNTHIHTFVNSVTVRAGPCQLSPNSVTLTGVFIHCLS